MYASWSAIKQQRQLKAQSARKEEREEEGPARRQTKNYVIHINPKKGEAPRWPRGPGHSLLSLMVQFTVFLQSTYSVVDSNMGIVHTPIG